MTAEKDRLAGYSTGIEVLAAGAIILVIGIMFQSLEANIASRISNMMDLPDWTQHIAWISWVPRICYVVSAPVLCIGAYLLHRIYRRSHPKDKRQSRLTSYR